MATNEIFSSHFTREAEQTTRSTTSCPECREDIIAANHETRCRECGLIVGEDYLDYGPEWFNSPENSSQRRTGTPLTAGRHDRGLSTEIGWQRDGRGNALPGRKRSQLNRLRREHRRSQWRTKRERNLGYGLGEVRRIVSALELPDSLCEQACLLFRRAQKEDLCQGRSLEGVAAASVYAVCRCNGLGRTLEEISQLATCSRSDLECAYSAMNTELEVPTTVPRPQNFLPRLATTLEVPDKIRHRALELATLAEDAGITSGRRPRGFAATCLYRASREFGYGLSQQEVADSANTSTATIRAHRDCLLEVLEDQK
ncbi:transcription initiation factor IIB [Natronosalvus amylolyticus]|uniref:transcription initiation factor IIB n=1 Tax=Natronosalvus amylolyticus TaxID=2961994 RepID=UPI0020C98139|nr:transcription initiation factor IIB family protein [Natronosalvus amylolyticus]